MSFNVATSGVGNGDAESGASLKIGTGRVEKSKGFPIRISTVKTYGHFKTEEEAIRLTRELKKLLAFTASIPQLSAWAGRNPIWRRTLQRRDTQAAVALHSAC